MRTIKTKYGKIFYKDGLYILEKVYKELASLINEESEIEKKVEDLGFVIEESDWYIEGNPEYKVEKYFNDKNPSKVRFRFIVKLFYNK